MNEGFSIISPLLEPLAALQRLLDRYADKGVLIGGLAVSLIGKPRLTADLDALLLISVDEVPELLEDAREEGLVERISSPLTFAQQNRVVLLKHIESGTNIDISLGILPFEQEIIDRCVSHTVGGIKLHLPTPEDLIILKAVAHRPKDLLDIQGIIHSHTKLDNKRIKYWVRQFAQLLELPELWDDIADWLSKSS